MSEMLKEVASFKQEVAAQVRSEAVAKVEEELPQGASAVEAKEEAPPEVTPEEPKVEAAEAAPVAPEEPETLIRIGDQTFKTQAEAIRYAEKLEYEKNYAEAHQQGVREAIQALAPQAAAQPEEDNFEEKFYTNPKAVIQEAEERATRRALATIDAEKQKENLWKLFEERYPEIDRQDAELVLERNKDTIGRFTNIDKGLEALAQRTRSEYQRIVDRMKPRTELHPSKGTSTIPSTSAPKSVTPQKKEEPVLTMKEQMSMLRMQKRNHPA